MLKLLLDRDKDANLQVLFLGAHSDDIEIGCGGTVLRLAAEYPHLCAEWIVFSAAPERSEEAHKSAEHFLAGVGKKNIVVKDFRDGYFPYRGEAIKDYFEELKPALSPDLIFTHYRQDLHQDHRLINELTWNTFRDHLILEYEIPKYDGDLGTPNFFVHLDKEICNRKIQYILKNFDSQKNRGWFTEDTFASLFQIRGLESRAPGGFAEGFYCRKAVF